ncbi:hypothetical protein HCJ76_00165 [Streptomyces sp. MC1]|uniref:hypothetical protein n=1 Tax=Streptomyces TaxID=1883 RepID=UPI0018C97064|nr:hypothetical protein [Streptomyces sp. MC1]MBG7696560.1 hypothetical protein [Streptomyces sp. MC1]
MPSPSGDPLRLLADARRTGTPPPALTDLGGPTLLTDARDELLDHDDLSALVTLVCNDAATLASPAGQDFLLAAAVPDDPLLLEDVVTALSPQSTAGPSPRSAVPSICAQSSTVRPNVPKEVNASARASAPTSSAPQPIAATRCTMPLKSGPSGSS